jgi:hypothetical protein
MNKPIDIKTKTKLSTLIILILGGIGFCFLSYYLTSKSLESEYPQIAGLVLGLFFGAFGLISIFSIWQLKKYDFDGDKLIVKSIFNTPKKVIYVRDIKSYNEIEKENKSGKWNDLTIFTDRQKEKISSSTISNYQQLKRALTKGIQRDEYSESLWSYKVNKRFGIGFIIIGLLFSIGMLKVYSKKDLEILPEQLTTIKATITETPEIERRKSSRWINLKLEEYPKFNFKISGIRYHAANSNEIVAEIKANDQIELDILKDTYDKKISQAKDLTFIDKTVNYNQITVNGLRKEGKIFLLLENINKEQKEDSTGYGFWILFTVGIGITLTGIYLITRKKPAANNGYKT